MRYVEESTSYIIPPMPPIPGSIGGIGGASFSGISVTAASVVKILPAIDVAICTATRATLVGSIIPASFKYLIVGPTLS